MREIFVLTLVVMAFSLTNATPLPAGEFNTGSPVSTIRMRELSSIEEPEFKEINVHCNRGIGEVEFKAKELLPGRKLVLILNLKGLECFNIDTGRIRLKVSVNSTDGSIRQYISTSRSTSEINLTKSSAMSITVRHRPVEGYFELIIPPALTRFFRKKVKLNWIDFYR